jgi:4-amino-4-deoxy-L-arabinose transferase-like glycosyltransferase
MMETSKNARSPSLTSTVKAILREGGTPLVVLLVLVLALKILFQFDHSANNPVSRHPVSDELLYIDSAAEIAGGVLSTGEVFHSAPLYPYLVAPIFAVCGPDPLAARLFQALLGAAAVLLFYLAARFYFSRPWALGAAAAMALYYPFTFFEGKLLIATSAVFFLNLVLFLFAAQIKIPKTGLAFAAGIAVGIASGLRPNLVLMIPLLALWLLWFFRKRGGLARALLFAAGAFLPILPFTWHNWKVADDFVLLSDNGGINFYLGNNPGAKGSFHVTESIWGHKEHQFFMAKQMAEQARGRTLKPSEVSSYWMEQGFAFAKEQPMDYLHLLFQKLKSFLENFEYAIIYTPSVERPLTPSLYIPFIPWAVFISAFALGLTALLFKGRGDGRWIVPLLIVAVNLFSILLFFNYSRFRMVALPSMILISLFGLQQWMLQVKGRKWKHAVPWALAGLLAFPVSLVPYGDLSRLQKAHGLTTIARAYRDDGDFTDADRYFTEAFAVGPDMGLILNERGRLRLENNDVEGAKADLEKAYEMHPDYPLCPAALADFFARPTPYQDLERALELILEAKGSSISSPTDQVIIQMTEGMVRMERKEYELALGAFQTAHYLMPSQPEPLFFMGKAYEGLGDMEKAREMFEKGTDN